MNARIDTTPAQAGLDSLFAPRSVAVVGASQDTTKIRGRLLKTLVDGGFAGPIYPVNPSSARIQGLTAYADVSALPEAVDLVLIAVAADQVMAVLEQCQARGCRSAAIFSAGANGLAPGERLQDHVQAFARRSGMRILGPNCEGFLDAQTGLIATFSPTLEFVAPRIPALLDGRARVSIVSQSGAMAFALFSRARQLHIPIRHLVSTGNEADVDLLEVAEHLIRAGETRALLLFVAQGRALLKCSHCRAQSLAGQLRRRRLLHVWRRLGFRQRHTEHARYEERVCVRSKATSSLLRLIIPSEMVRDIRCSRRAE